MNSYINNTIIPYSGVPIIHTEVTGYEPSNLISFLDFTDNILENNTKNYLYSKIEKIPDTYEYLLPPNLLGSVSGSLLVTDRIVDSKLVDITLPLFYQYQLLNDQYVLDASIFDSVIVVRKNMSSVVSFDNYIIENREYPTASGRYNIDNSGGFEWSSKASSNILTTRLLLPVREFDNYYTVEYNKYNNGSITEYWNELVSEKLLYENGTDYNITPSSIILTENTRLTSGVLYIQKNPDSFIKIQKPFTTNDKYKTSEWFSSINCGNIIKSSGIYEGYVNYTINNNYSLNPNNIIEEVPKIISKNIIKTNLNNIYETNAIVSLLINGIEFKNKVLSIDYNNGYIYVGKDINETDSIVITYKIDDTKSFVIKNLDLNPINSISGVIDIAEYSIGLALVPDNTKFLDSTGTPVEWSHLSCFKMNDYTDIGFNSGISGYALESVNDTSMPISGVIPSGSLLLGFFAFNNVSQDMVKVTDIRRLGGYDKTILKNTVSNYQDFSDIGYYDGIPVPKAGTLIIQIPKIVQTNIYNLFNSNYIRSEITTTYTKDLEKIINKDNTKLYDSEAQQIKEASDNYIKKTIERYLPFGTLYIIVDEDFNKWDI